MAIACHNAPKNPGGFTINGTIKGMESGIVYFGYSDSVDFHTDSVPVKDGHFIYMGKVAEPVQAFMWLKKEEGRMVDPFDFFIEDTVSQLNATKDSLKQTVLTGSHVEDLYLQYKEALKPVKDKMNQLNKAYTAAADRHDEAAFDSLDRVYDKLAQEQQEAMVSYVDKNPSSIIGAWTVNRNLLYDADIKILQKLYTGFTPAVQQSQYAKTIKKEIDIQLKLQTGMVAPDFTMNDTTGKPLSLSSFKGKYLLLDFWASWCGPCRRENPNVVKAYNEFKDKNFTILGVSLDENKGRWEKAIHDDGLAWNHVSDLKGWKNEAADQYGIRAIPSNYLLDPDGKIIAHNLRGEELKQKLAELVK